MLRLENQSLGASANPEVRAYWDGRLKEADANSGVRESVCSLFADHDTVGLLVVRVLDDSHVGPEAWRRLEADWERLSGPSRSSTTVGSAPYGCSAYLGLAVGTSVSSIKAQVSEFVGAGEHRPFELTASGISLWRLTPLQGRALEPRFVAVAPEAEEQALDDWSWNLQTAGRPWLCDYATECAKLRYAYDVLLELFDRERESRQQLRVKIDDLLSVLVRHSIDGDSDRAAKELGRQLTTLAQTDDHVTDQFWYLNELEVTAHVARTNLVELIENQLTATPASRVRNNPFNSERDLADWLTVQVKIERDYTKAVLDRADRVVGRARGVVEASRTASTARQADSVATFTVITTTLLTTLTAVTILPESKRVDISLVAILASVVAALTLYIGLGVVRLDSRKRWFDYLVATATGVCVGLGLPWLFGKRFDWDLASAAQFAVPSVVGVLVATGLYRLSEVMGSRKKEEQAVLTSSEPSS